MEDRDAKADVPFLPHKILLWLTATAFARRDYSEEVEIPVARDGNVTSTGIIVEFINGHPNKPSDRSIYLQFYWENTG